MAHRINRAIELLGQDQAIYYTGPHSGHVLSYAQGREDAGTWADYINVGMEHGCFDMSGLEAYMRGMVDGGPTRSGHRTPTVIVEAPVNGTDEANVRFNSWQFRQILARGVHGILLCQAETADAVRAFVEGCRYPHHLQGVDPAIPTPLQRMEGAHGIRGGRGSGGIHGIDPATGKVAETLEAQCAHMFAHVRTIVEAAGGHADDIIKMTVWMTDRSQRQALNHEWLKMFPDEQARPARHTQRAALDGGMLIQCDFTAVID